MRICDKLHLVADGDMSADIISQALPISWMSGVSFEVSWTGSPVGVFTIEGSNSGANWEAIDFGSAIDTTDVTKLHLINASLLQFASIRFHYARTSGSGTCNVWYESKEV